MKLTEADHWLFDLDGTLVNSSPGITRCLQYALEKLGKPVLPAQELLWCIGPDLRDSFRILLQTEDQEEIEQGVVYYRERYQVDGIFENELYPGISEALKHLWELGLRLYLATSKPLVYARQIIVQHGLNSYFETLHGSEINGRLSDKAELIDSILQYHQLVPRNVVMIGDRKHDIIGARKNGVQGLGVLWGFGSKEELHRAGADLLVDHPHELVQLASPKPMLQHSQDVKATSAGI